MPVELIFIATVRALLDSAEILRWGSMRADKPEEKNQTHKVLLETIGCMESRQLRNLEQSV